MKIYLFLCSTFSILLVVSGCWDLDLPDTKAPGFDDEDPLDSSQLDTSDIALGTDSTFAYGEDSGFGSDTLDTATGAQGLTCPGNPCDLPPLSICENSSSLRVYLDAGTCYEGECIYAWSLEPCDEYGCADGRCLEDPCADVICDLPPDNSCANSDTLIVWDTDGQCDTEGLCHYPGTSVDCTPGCEEGACIQSS